MAIKINGTNTTASPGITGPDTDTGLVYGTDEVQVVTGGTTRATVDSAGNVGINNSSPSSYNSDGRNLVVGSGSGGQGLTIASGTSGYGNIYFADGTSGDALYSGMLSYYHADNHMQFRTASTERMRLDSSGNLGLGTSSPQRNAHFNSSTSEVALKLTNSTSGSGSSDGTDIKYEGLNLTINNRESGAISFETANTSRMQIDSSGGATFAGQMFINCPNATALRIRQSASGDNKIVLKNDGSATFAGGAFAIASDGDISTNIRGNGHIELDSTGSFSSPKVKLFADTGNATFAGNVTAANVSDIKFKENITDAKPQLADAVALGSQLKNFDWNDDAPLNEELRAKRFLGLVAQEAEKVSPGLTYTVSRTKQGAELTPEATDEEGNVTPATYEELDDSYKAINHDILVMKLLGAVAEQNTQIETLKTQNASLEARLIALEGGAS